MMEHPDTLSRITVDGVDYLHVHDSVIDQHTPDAHVCDLCPNLNGPTTCEEFRWSHRVSTRCAGGPSNDSSRSFIPFTTYGAWRLTGATT
jgi:hypothetical protein